MNTKTPKKILICLLLIGTVAFGSMTYSAFSDTETSEGNTIAVSTEYQSSPSYEMVTLVMENIDIYVKPPEIPQIFNLTDAIGGNFTYKNASDEFEYDFEANVLLPATEYVLVMFDLQSHGNFKVGNSYELDRGFSNDTGVLLLNGSENFDQDLIDKLVFLVSSDGCGVGHSLVNWERNLYATELIQYEDTNN